MKFKNEDELRQSLTDMLNRLSIDNEVDTQDFLLDDHLIKCLHVFNETTKTRQDLMSSDTPEPTKS